MDDLFDIELQFHTSLPDTKFTTNSTLQITQNLNGDLAYAKSQIPILSQVVALLCSKFGPDQKLEVTQDSSLKCLGQPAQVLLDMQCCPCSMPHYHR